MTPEELNPSPEDMRKVMRAMQVRMRNTALHHFEHVDPRTLRVLQNLGLFKDEASPIGDGIDLSVLQDPQHARRQDLPDGPLVLYVTEEDDPKRMIVELPVLLFSDSRSMRQAALESIEKMLVKDPFTVTPKTLAVLKESRDALRSDTPSNWRSAAVAVCDALYDDVLIALGGMRQCLESEPVIQSSLNFYAPKVIHPSVSSLDSISLPIGHPEKDHAHLAKVLSEIVNHATNLAQMCHLYLDKLGFLPLAPPYSLSAAVENWLASNSDVDVWTQIWEWANTEQTPLSRYHACSVFVRHPELIPDGELPVLWNEVLDIVHDLSNEGADKPANEPWALRRDLAKHYIYHLEARLPGNDGASIACFAWWLTEQVATLLPADVGASKFYRENWVKPASDLSSQIWLAASSPIQVSILRYFTLNVASPWAVALLALMGEQLERLAFAEQEKKVQARFHEAVVLNSISSMPFPLEHPNDPTFAFEIPLANTVLKYAEYQEEEHRKGLQQLVETSRTLGTNSNLFEALRKLGESGLPDQVAVCLALKAKAYTDPTVTEGVWEIVSDADWRRKVLGRTEMQVQGLLIESLSVLLVGNREKWFWLFPHYIADICEDEEDKERKRVLFLYVIHTSLASDTVSAVRRLLRGNQKAKFIEHVKEYRAHVDAMYSHYPPWVAGKFRGLMASMHVV